MMRGPCVNGAASVAEERDKAVVVCDVSTVAATPAPFAVDAAGANAAADPAASRKVVKPSFIVLRNVCRRVDKGLSTGFASQDMPIQGRNEVDSGLASWLEEQIHA